MTAFLLRTMLLLGCVSAAWGMEAPPANMSQAEVERAASLAAELRCLVCQNQTIADSNAELAVDLRRQIREQMAQGRSDREIIDYMVARYGDFVLYRPPFKATTLLLWGGPPLLLVIGAVVMMRNLQARRRRPAERELTDEERGRAARLLAGRGGEEA